MVKRWSLVIAALLGVTALSLLSTAIGLGYIEQELAGQIDLNGALAGFRTASVYAAILACMGAAPWVFADAQERAPHQALAWGVAAILGGPLTAVVYLMLRPRRIECEACGETLAGEGPYCSHCGHEVAECCPDCGRPVAEDGNYCRGCGSRVGGRPHPRPGAA